jgi:predicted dehydrogenase
MRIGIIGFGGAGRAHYSYFSCIPGCTVTKVYDPKPAGLQRAAAMIPGVTCCDSLEEFWKDLDAVTVCSPDSTHADYIVGAIDHGLPVLCEKPLTDSLEGIRKIVAAAAKAKTTVAVLHQMRHTHMNEAARNLISSGELGAISLMEGYYVHNLVTRSWLYDDWRRTDNATPMVYAGCHFVDLLRWYAGGKQMVEVYAAANHMAFPEYPESDLNIGIFRFDNGMLGKVLVSFGSACAQDHSIRIYGNKACIDNNLLLRHDGTRIKKFHKPKLVQRVLLNDPVRMNGHLLKTQLKWNGRAVLAGALFELLERVGPPAEFEYGVRHYPIRLYEHAEACVLAVQDFIDTATGKKATPMVDVTESSRTVLACLAAVDSYRSGKPAAVKRLEEVVA